jgi:predicted small secreted protein
MRSTRKFVSLAAVLLLVSVLVAGCNSAATTAASCSFIAGNGQNNSDAKLHSIVYPGQVVSLGQNETATYVPCNSRNYIITDGIPRTPTATP